MRHGTRQLSGERARHGSWHPATGLVLRRRVAGFYSAVDTLRALAKAIAKMCADEDYEATKTRTSSRPKGSSS